MGGPDDGRYKCKYECECKTEVSLTGTPRILLLPQKSADHRVFSQITLMTDELISFTLPHARRWTQRWLQPSATQALSRVQAVCPFWGGGEGHRGSWWALWPVTMVPVPPDLEQHPSTPNKTHASKHTYAQNQVNGHLLNPLTLC